MQSTTKSLIFIGSILAMVFLFAGLYILLSSTRQHINKKNNAPTPSPTTVTKALKPVSMQRIPTLSPQRGSGVDTNAESVKKSISEIQKLSPYLPYKKDYVLSTGIPVSIVIPSLDLMNNPWTLSIQIFGVDYHLPESDPDYFFMKQSFLEAVADINSWLLLHNASTEKIYITWGDNPTINRQADIWLRKQ